jgi:hypothetical protein
VHFDDPSRRAKRGMGNSDFRVGELGDARDAGIARVIADSILRKEHGRLRGPERVRTLPVAARAQSAGSSRVHNGYVSSGMGGHARPLNMSEIRLICSENVPARAREWARVPHPSFPRNEGVRGSSPRVGFSQKACFCRPFRAAGFPRVTPPA